MTEPVMFGEGHAHIFMDGADYHASVEAHRNGPDERRIRAHLAEYQQRGISFVRDGGDHFGASFLARETGAGVWDHLPDARGGPL